MNGEMKLTSGEKNMLRLVAKGTAPDGWAPVSAPVVPMIEMLPGQLVEFQRVGDQGRGRVRLTAEGAAVLDAMAWL